MLSEKGEIKKVLIFILRVLISSLVSFFIVEITFNILLKEYVVQKYIKNIMYMLLLFAFYILIFK